jgi:hypothetical protein
LARAISANIAITSCYILRFRKVWLRVVLLDIRWASLPPQVRQLKPSLLAARKCFGELGAVQQD